MSDSAPDEQAAFDTLTQEQLTRFQAVVAELEKLATPELT